LLDVATDWLLEGNVDLITVSAAGALKNHETVPQNLSKYYRGIFGICFLFQ